MVKLGLFNVHNLTQEAGRGSSIGSVFAWRASGPEFDPVHSFVEIFYGHSPSSTDSRRSVVSYWQKNVH